MEKALTQPLPKGEGFLWTGELDAGSTLSASASSDVFAQSLHVVFLGVPGAHEAGAAVADEVVE
jgi:hypothetical protein